ncbi:glycoside hydrolase family 3 N-terminal domain-containing protein [Tropicimonas isoalkanivorans]|uniref:Beta-D-glucoside glucohydrolase n=1 Tax=Tropicimonas isoalkanivorans TaxID=441112 RepID=A0A1I1Q489_9RHOB|nr:glycoside hydrolase family 3 N-terminal domain-containing protein [Tropicimonas isoalkanivorans]SFD16817.1 beta-glucosidase [Tropicimonas isoalkanivorans]
MTDLYKDPAQSIEARVDDLLARMSLEEKIGQMHSVWLFLNENGQHTTRSDQFTGSSDQDTLKDMLNTGLGQITRPLGTRTVEPAAGVRALNSLQKYLVEETRLGIPVMSHEECLSGLMISGATLFPSALSFGATWNPELVERVGDAIGAELRMIGCHQGLAPVLDVARDSRWGRTEETFGEDPYLTGVLATRYVRGLQGEKRDVLATLKHYAGHSASEGGRNHAPVHMGWRELNDTFLLPFEMAVKLGNAGSVMPAYHDIDNEPVHASKHLLTKVLRDDWGFDGIVVADYVGVSLLYQHHGIATDTAEAAALSFNAGLDVELPGNDCAKDLKLAIERGQISLDKVDEVVRRVLTEKFRIGLFEKPYTDDAAIELRSDAAVQVAREVAEQSVVILDNNGVLPLDDRAKVAVIGPTADDPLALLGDYSFPVHLIHNEETDDVATVVTPRAGLEAALGDGRVVYARGCNILDERKAGAPVFPGDVDDSTSLQQASPLSSRLDMIPEAVAAAEAADVAIVCVGDLSGIFQTGTVGEGSDVDTLELPGVQQQLLDAVVATGKPVIVVVISGRPYNLGGLEDKIAAQVWAFFAGQEGGTALASVLTGAIEPSGRLTLSVPRSVGAAPYFYNHAFKSSGTPIARHFGSRYPFGHGLAYTDFEFANLELEADTVDIESGDVRLSFEIRNTGKRDGVAVPQLYVRDELASVVRPVKELKAFGRVSLKAGETARVTFSVPSDMLSFTGPEGTRIVEPGFFTLMVGASSGDIRLTGRVEGTGARRTLPKDWRMESTCEFETIATSAQAVAATGV